MMIVNKTVIPGSFLISDHEIMFKSLMLFFKKYGHCKVPKRYKGGTELAKWVFKLRKIKKSLPDDFVSKLDQLGFIWDIRDHKMEEWQRAYLKLKSFYEKYGHSKVSKGYPDRALAKWVIAQRSLKLTNEQRDKLNELNFIWRGEYKTILNCKWEENYNLLKKFHTKYGHCLVSSAYNKKLSLWVCEQRQLQQSLSDVRRNKLNGLGFFWGSNKYLVWELMYQQLLEFYATHKHSDVPCDFKENPKLGNWVKVQRDKYSKLTLYQVKLLERVKFKKKGFRKKSEQDIWENYYAQLNEFFVRYRHCRVPANRKQLKDLHHWCRRQRVNENKMSEERKKRLNLLNFIWSKDFVNSADKNWESMFEEYKSFIAIHGNVPIPTNNLKYKKLRNWFVHNKQMLNSLPKSRREKLEPLIKPNNVFPEVSAPVNYRSL
jgi:hypothetical protein